MLKKKKTPKDCESLQFSFNTRFILRPEHTLRFAWELLMMCSLLLLGLAIPYTPAFEKDNKDLELNMNYFTTTVFSLDILVTINSGIYVKGQLKMTRSGIMSEYLKFWFWIDILSTIPFELALSSYISESELNSAVSIGRGFNILKLLMLLKLLRLSKLRTMFMKIEDHMTGKTSMVLLKIFKNFFYLFLVAHFFACLMFIVSSENLSPNSFVMAIETNMQQNYSNMTPDKYYVVSLYWAFTTMFAIGYGDLTPRTTSEKILAIATMNITSIVFGYLIGNVGSVIEKHASKDKEKSELLVNINNIIKIHKIPHEVKLKARKYINLYYSRSKNRLDFKELLNVLSQPLREEIYSYINGETISLMSFFKDLSSSSRSRLAKILKPQVNTPGDIIFVENDEALSMYFIMKGCVDVIDLKSKTSIKILADRYFGEIGLFADQPRSASVHSLTFLESLCLTKMDLKILNDQFPEMQKKLEFIRISTLNGDLSALKVECYLCKSIGHIAKTCKKITEHDSLQKKWLTSRRESMVVRAADQGFRKKIIREPKLLRITDLYTNNVFGHKRKLRDLYFNKRRFVGAVKRFLKELPAKSDDSASLSGHGTLLSQESDMSYYLNHHMDFDNFLSDSSGSDIDKNIEKPRKKSFDSSLLDSTMPFT